MQLPHLSWVNPCIAPWSHSWGWATPKVAFSIPKGRSVWLSQDISVVECRWLQEEHMVWAAHSEPGQRDEKFVTKESYDVPPFKWNLLDDTRNELSNDAQYCGVPPGHVFKRRWKTNHKKSFKKFASFTFFQPIHCLSFRGYLRCFKKNWMFWTKCKINNTLSFSKFECRRSHTEFVCSTPSST